MGHKVVYKPNKTDTGHWEAWGGSPEGLSYEEDIAGYWPQGQKPPKDAPHGLRGTSARDDYVWFMPGVAEVARAQRDDVQYLAYGRRIGRSDVRGSVLRFYVWCDNVKNLPDGVAPGGSLADRAAFLNEQLEFKA